MNIPEKKRDDDGFEKVLRKLDKTTLLQEARYFNSSPVNPRKCIDILTKMLYLLNQGEKLTTQEATDMFFATTKLFQSKDVILRRLVYLCIKELSPIAEDVIIVTSSLTKDMTGKEDLYRSAAIRTLCSITDTTILQAIDRYMKQAILDKNPAVSSAALVSSLHLSSRVSELVRRWGKEAEEGIGSANSMVSCHALAVVASIRRNDRMSTVKLVSGCSKSLLRSPYALALLVRLAAKLVEEDQSEMTNSHLQFIEYCLHHKSEIVKYEAAHALVNLTNVRSTQSLTDIISVLQMFCGSSKACVRLAGVRTLAKLTAKYPGAVADCTSDLENLITDPNRSIATLAVTTLLATGAETSVDRLMKQISGFMSDVSDEFKIVIVQAIRGVCSKYPHKHQSVTAFLAGMLRNEGGVQYKTAIADAIISLVEESPGVREAGLAHLCEFIEDCEHSSLAIQILHLLGREGPKAVAPSRFIRYIYNRVMLEFGPVRAAAVATLARFGAARTDLRPNVKILLERCQMDNEDEVRDRAVLYHAILSTDNQKLITDCITNVPIPNPVLLEKALADFISSGRAEEETFDIATVPLNYSQKDGNDGGVENEAGKQKAQSLEEQYVDELKIVPSIERLGPLFKTCKGIDLTEPETEYRVRCVKHIYARHVVLQFECLNTLSDQLLEEVYVRLQEPDGFKSLCEVHCPTLPYDKQGSIFCLLVFPENPIYTESPFEATLEFVVHDCDPTTGSPDSNEGYADTYQLEEFEIRCADQFRLRAASDDFETSWEAAASVEVCDTFGLAQTEVEAAAIAVCDHLGLPKEAIVAGPVKEIRAEGLWRGGAPVLMRARLVAAQGTVTMQLAVRCPKEEVATFLVAAIEC